MFEETEHKLPTLAVAMATFNGADFVREQLASIAAQSHLPNELVICDDGSQDETVSIIERFAKNSPFPVKLTINSERLGYIQNFFKAVSLCNSDLIALSDQDDIWFEDKCGEILNAFEDRSLEVINHDYVVSLDQDRRKIPSYFDYMRGVGYPRCANIKGCSLAFRASVLDGYNFHDEAALIPHDYALCLIGAARGTRGYIGAQLMSHRIHSKNTSGFLFNSKLGVDAILKRLLTFPRSRGEELEYLVWIGTNAGNAKAVSHIVKKERVAARFRQTVHVNGAITTALGASSTRTSSLWSRAVSVSKLLVRGAYRGRGWQIGLLKGLLGQRGRAPLS